MSECGRYALPDVRDWSGGPFVGTRDVGRPSRMFGSIGDDFMEDREWSGGSRGFAGMAGKPSRRYGRCREAYPDVWEWWG